MTCLHRCAGAGRVLCRQCLGRAGRRGCASPGYRWRGPMAAQPDWAGLGRDTGFFLGYQLAVVAALYAAPEDTLRLEQGKKAGLRRRRVATQRQQPQMGHRPLVGQLHPAPLLGRRVLHPGTRAWLEQAPVVRVFGAVVDAIRIRRRSAVRAGFDSGCVRHADCRLTGRRISVRAVAGQNSRESRCTRLVGQCSPRSRHRARRFCCLETTCGGRRCGTSRKDS